VGTAITPVRTYPPHLRQFERYDEALLPLVDDAHALTLGEIAVLTGDRDLRNVLARWLTSAEWRGLVSRNPADGQRGPTYVRTAAAAQRPPRAA
jgi:hypothetical protein